jgi:hypothetical protein
MIVQDVLDSSLLCLIGSLLLLAVGVVALSKFLQSDFFSSTGFDDDAGFDSSQWLWLLTGTYFLPLSLCLHFIFLVQSYKKRWNAYAKLVLYYFLLSGCLYGLVFSFQQAADVLACGLFCLGPIPTAEEVSSQASSGQVAVGLVYFFSLIPITVLYICLIIGMHVKLLRNSREVISF